MDALPSTITGQTRTILITLSRNKGFHRFLNSECNTWVLSVSIAMAHFTIATRISASTFGNTRIYLK